MGHFHVNNMTNFKTCVKPIKEKIKGNLRNSTQEFIKRYDDFNIGDIIRIGDICQPDLKESIYTIHYEK